MAGSRRRAARVAVGLLAPLLGLAACFLTTWSDLPPVLASHWDQDGWADAFVVRSVRLWLTPIVIVTSTWGLLTMAMSTVPRGARGARWLRALPSGVAWFGAVLTISLVHSQRGLVDPQESRYSATWILVSCLAGLVGYGLAVILFDKDAPGGPSVEHPGSSVPGT